MQLRKKVAADVIGLSLTDRERINYVRYVRIVDRWDFDLPGGVPKLFRKYVGIHTRDRESFIPSLQLRFYCTKAFKLVTLGEQ